MKVVVATPINIDLYAWWFMAVVGILLPVAAIRSARRFDAVSDPAHQTIPQRLKSVMVLVVLAAMALFVAWHATIDLFQQVEITGSLIVRSVVVLFGVLVLAELLLRARSPAGRKALWVRQILPRSNAERAVWVLTSSIAGIAEEIVFRGLFFILVSAVTNSYATAAVTSAIVFAIAHFSQGWKSMIFVFAIALVFQWLMFQTGSLIPAMVVHALYNIARGIRASVGMENVDAATG